MKIVILMKSHGFHKVFSSFFLLPRLCPAMCPGSMPLYGVSTSRVMRVTRTPGKGSIPSIRKTFTCECPPPTKTKSFTIGVRSLAIKWLWKRQLSAEAPNLDVAAMLWSDRRRARWFSAGPVVRSFGLRRGRPASDATLAESF